MSPTRPELNSRASSLRVSETRVAGVETMSVISVLLCALERPSRGRTAVCPAQLGQVAQGGNAGQEEVGASKGPDELRQALVAAANRARLDREGGTRGGAVARERVRVVVEAVEGGVVQPCVLDELELPGQVGRQAHEVQAGSAGAVRGGAVAAGAAQQPVQAAGGKRGREAAGQRVARIRPANVGTDRAGHAGQVIAVREVVVVAQRGSILVWCLDQRRAAGPPADHLGGEGGPRGGILRSVRSPCDRVQESPESLNVLLKLPEDQVSAVAAEVDRAAVGRIWREQAYWVIGRRQQRAVG